jgi:20S proteasome subunit beta 4
MECLIGITGKDFVILAADTNHAHSIVVLKHGNKFFFLILIESFWIIYSHNLDDEKLFKLSRNTAMLVAGEPGDKIQFSEYIQKNLQLYKMINGNDNHEIVSSFYTFYYS